MEFWSKHSRKMFFSSLVVLLYLVVANPATYKFVGSIIGLDEYDNANKPDRDTLLYIHSVVMGILCFIALLIYNPMYAHI